MRTFKYVLKRIGLMLMVFAVIMTICFVSGVIFNSERIIAERKEAAKLQRKRRATHKKK